MAISMIFIDRDGTEVEIFDPSPIDSENVATAADLKALREQLASGDPAISAAAEKAAESLFRRRQDLRIYAKRWNDLVDEARQQRRVDLIAAIDALPIGDFTGVEGGTKA